MATIYELARQRTKADMDLAACAVRSREIVLNYERSGKGIPVTGAATSTNTT